MTPPPSTVRVRVHKQRRKRDSEAGIAFTDAYLERVEALIGGSNTATSAATEFKAALLAFTTLGSTHAELESLKNMTEVLIKLSRGSGGGVDEGQGQQGPSTSDQEDGSCVPDASFADACGVFMGLMFLANSRPVHRQLITAVRRLTPTGRVVAEAALDREVLDALAAARSQQGAGATGAGKLRPAGPLASINGCQPQTGREQRVLRRAAVPAAALIAEGIHAMIDEVVAGRHTPPVEMETAHDAIAVAYCLLHRHSDAFIAGAGGASPEAGVKRGRDGVKRGRARQILPATLSNAFLTSLLDMDLNVLARHPDVL